MNRIVIKNSYSYLRNKLTTKTRLFSTQQIEKNVSETLASAKKYVDHNEELKAKSSLKYTPLAFNSFQQSSEHQSNYKNKSHNDHKQKTYKNIPSQLSKLFALVFLAHLYSNTQQYNTTRCDYDIDDMMLTIQLDERLMQEEEDNQQLSEEEKRQMRRKKKKLLKERKYGKKIVRTRQQRYGSPEQMIKNQLANSEDFQSLEERLLFREIEQNKSNAKQQQEVNKNQKPTQKKQNQGKQQNLAKFIFQLDKKTPKTAQKQKPQQPQQKSQQLPTSSKPEFDYTNKPVIIVDNNESEDDAPPMTKQQQKIQNDATLNEYQKTLKFMNEFSDDQLGGDDDELFDKDLKQKTNKKKTDIFKLEELKTKHRILPPISEDDDDNKEFIVEQKDGKVILKLQNDFIAEKPDTNTQQKQQNSLASNPQPIQISTQNCATINIPSKSFFPLALRIQNFLKARGISQIHQTKQNKQQNNKTSLQEQASKQKLSLRLCNKISQCKNIEFKNQQQQTRDVFHHINNFINPPHIIETVQQAKQILKIIDNDEYIVGTFIPKSQQPTQRFIFDTFSLKHQQPRPCEAEQQFNQYKYLSSTKKNLFFITHNKQVANYLKMSDKKIGIPHILHKYDKQYSGKFSQPNTKIDGEVYHSIGNFDKIIQKEKLDTKDKIAHKINQLTEKGFTNMNFNEDLFDKVRHLEELRNGFSFTDVQNTKDLSSSKNGQINKKLLVVKINDTKPQANQEINKILQKVSKICRNQVSIIKTQSQALIKSALLKIMPADQYGTVRLFDFNHTQQPIIPSSLVADKQCISQKRYFKRFLLEGPFQIEYLSRWISNLQPKDQKQYLETERDINRIKASYPGDFQPSQNKQTQQLKLVLFYKDGCKGCKMMQQLVDKIQQLKKRLSSSDPASQTIANRIKRQICIHYRIQNPQTLAHLNITKYNILNQDTDIQVPQTTPKLFMFNSNNTKKVMLKTDEIFNHLNKVNAHNGQKIIDEMVRDLIQEMERKSKIMETVV